VALANIDALTTPAATHRTVAVTAANGKLKFATKTLPSGSVTFVVTNKGKGTAAFAAMGLGLNKKTPPIAAGRTGKLTVALKPGTYHFWDAVGSSMTKAVYLPVRQAVDVSLANGKLTFSTKTLPKGPVMFVVVNKGKSTAAFAAMGLGLMEETTTIRPGKSAMLALTLKSGTYHFWDPVRSTMEKAVYLSVKGSAPTGSGSTGGGSTGGGSGGGGGYTPPPGGGSGGGTTPPPMDHAGDGCDH
jgi:hypothetical protein